MNKKDFKKLAKDEKHISIKLMNIGSVMAIFGLALVIVAMIFVINTDAQIICFVIGGVFAMLGAIIDLVGEAKLSKDFKKHKERM
ncbi:MAG TPA: hypothetical protein IAB65_02210 [Candidatus Onthocola stercorigallinarum]|nr:hypothetical protein [Candidatus Onthocola stercorigallinarum]